MKTINYKKNNMRGGFTLVEALVAIAIFTTSILALLSILSPGIASTNYAKQKIIASYLAQEGVEYVRNIRDSMVLSNADATDGWIEFLAMTFPLCVPGGTGCYIDDANSIVACDMGSCDEDNGRPIFYDGETGKYNYTTGVDSGYQMRITIEPIGDDEVKVSAADFWMQGSGKQRVTFSDDLLNWIE